MTFEYSDKQYEIHQMLTKPGYKVIAEVFKDNGRLIAALFEKGEG